LAALEEQEITLQELVDCLQDRDSLTFEVSTFALETLQISDGITIRSGQGASTSLACLDGPIFIIKYVHFVGFYNSILCSATDVNVNNLEIKGCRLDSEDAPVVIRSGSNVEMTSVNFTNNRNDAGSAALKTETDSILVIEDCHFRRNSGLGAHALEARQSSSTTIRSSAFRRNNGNGSTLNIIDANTLTISSSTFVKNVATLGGSVLRIEVRKKRGTIPMFSFCRVNKREQQLSSRTAASLKTMKL